MFNISNTDIIKFANLKNKYILITGATGFVGLWFIKLLKYLNDNYNFSITIYAVARNKNNLFSEMFSSDNKIHFLPSDVRNQLNIPNNINYIIHAASSTDNRYYMSNPIEAIDIITKGTKNIFDISLSLENLEKIVLLSSGQVYGKVNNDSINEYTFGPMSCENISSFYPEAKRYSETIASAYRSLYKLPVSIIRLFSFIGPLMSLDKPWAINNFVRDALKTKEIRILGNGKPIRSYMYPTDMAISILHILLNKNTWSTYNLGSDVGYSLEDIAVQIKKIIGNDVKIKILNLNDDKSIFVPNIEKLKNEFGIDIQTNIEKILFNSIKWFEKTL
ncbi:MAG: NAD-dependent epimerase/dehydratase family protein [Campylobacteraceae bacterium]